MKRVVLLILFACSTRSVPDAGVVVPALAPPTVEPPLTGSHGAAIELVAISDDGSAVVTQDAIGGTRLWPSLDGKREPIVLGVQPATQLAIARSGDGFVIASRDQGGGAEVVHLAATGTVKAHASIAPDPVIESIAIAPEGVLAVRADQTLAVFSADGDMITRLEAPAASRIRQVATRGGRTLVLFAHDDTTNGRWLSGTTWGGVTPDFQLDPASRAVLSPNGKRLLIDFEGAAYLLDTETGKIIENYGGGLPLGFVDDDTSIELGAGKLVWQQVGGAFGSAREGTAEASEPAAVANDIVVTAKGTSLVLHTPERAAQLGYRMTDVVGMHVVDDHVAITGAAQQVQMLDPNLDPRSTPELPDDLRVLGDLLPIDDRFVIATHTFNTGTWWSLSVLDLGGHKTWQAFQHPLGRSEIRYEPSTGYLEITDSVASYLTRWDPKTLSFETWYTLAGGAAEVYLLDPRRNNGFVAVALRSVKGQLEINEIAGTDVKVGAPIAPKHTYQVNGYAVAVDLAGRVYAIDKGTLVMYEHGTEIGRIADVGDARVAPHPSGAYIALWGDQRIGLYEANGTQRWQIAAPLAQRIAWLGDDLVVDYAGGLGKIDAATGALIKRTCGWSFGLSALSTNDVIAGESICDAQ